MSLQASVRFGKLLRQLRKRAGMTQGDLAAAVGYSTSFISSLEQNIRLPDVNTMLQTFVPALGLQDEPHAAALLIESAALARGERPPSSLILRRETRLVISETHIDALTALPMSPTTLIGREQDIQLLSKRLLGHSGRLLTLVGPPGVGKTHLGLEVAARVQGLYKDGVALVTLVAITDPELVASALMTQLGLSENAAKSPAQILLEFLRHKELLLILDNFEQLLHHSTPRPAKNEGGREEGEFGNASVRLVAELLAACPGLHILITSRERLHLRAEQRYRVSALEVADAVDLFVQRAQNANQDFQLTAQNRTIIAEICRQVDYLPLAIELTAARTDLFGPTTLLARLQQRPLDLLNTGPPDLPLRQRTLANAIGWSYNLLSGAQQQLLARLSVFSSGCTLAAAQQVCEGVPDELDALVEKSLLKAQSQPAGEIRFVLLETIREFARIQLSAQDPNKRTQQRQAEYFLALAEEAQRNSQGAQRQATLEKLMQESENLRAALAYTLAAQQPDLAFRLIKALVWFWYCQAMVSEGRQRVQQAMQTFAGAHDTELYADVVSAAGYLARVQGDWPSARHFFQESMLIYQKLSRPQKLAATQSQYSEALLNTGAIEDALAQIEAATVSLKQCGQPAAAELAYALHIHGRLLMQLQNYAQARAIYEESLALFRNSQSASGIAIVLYSLAQIDMREQAYAAAQTKHLASLVLYEKLNNKLMMGANQFFLGYLARVQGDYPQAMQYYYQGLQGFIQMGNTGSIVGALTDIAKLAMALQRDESAGFLFGKAAQLRESIGETQWKALPAERAEYEQHLATLSQTLGQLKFQQTWQTGASMALEKVLEVVLGLQAQLLQ
ncbi:MAG: helix-turn-helix domain-containing protein [Chloroflexi bacterium]|nr:helix-turn-helix domain-containing protein [Chloroflexota bacterium]